MKQATKIGKWIKRLFAHRDPTARIKTFEDAREWCLRESPYDIKLYDLVRAAGERGGNKMPPNMEAYFKLRIIAAALNNGWTPNCLDSGEQSILKNCDKIRSAMSNRPHCNACQRLRFKNQRLAIYAATQFAEIYVDFCDCTLNPFNYGWWQKYAVKDINSTTIPSHD